MDVHEISPKQELLERLIVTVERHERFGWGTKSGCEQGLHMVLHAGLPEATQKWLCRGMDAWMSVSGRWLEVA